MYWVKKRIHGGVSRRAISAITACILLFVSTGVQISFADESYCSYEYFDTNDNVGMFSSIGLDSSGNPAACYYDATSKNLKYAELYDTPETVDSDGDVGQYCSMKIKSNTVHVSYYDTTNGLKYAYKQSGSGWNVEKVDEDSAVGKYTSIAVDSSGRPHISYYDTSNGGRLKYAYRDHQPGETGAWHTEVVDDPSANVGQYSSIAVDGSGHVHISYYDASNTDLWYANGSSSSWSRRAIDNNGNVGQYSSIAVNSSNKPMVSYYDAAKKVKYAYMTSGGSWQTSTVDGSTGVTSIACDSNNKPHISYRDTSNNLKYGYMSGTSWQIFTVDSMSSSAQSTSIAVDGQKPHIGYYDANSDMAYARVDAPLITGTDPSSGSTGVSITSSLSLTFNKNIQAGNNFAEITLKDSKGTFITPTSTISGNTITIAHAPLKYGTAYTVTIPTGAVSDYPIAYSFSFTTKSDSGPTVSSTDPSNGATGVDKSKSIIITFSENVKAGSSASSSIGMKDSDGKPIQITTTFMDNILTIKQGAPATNTGSSSGNPFFDLLLGNNTNQVNNSVYGSYTYGKTYTVTIPAESIINNSNKPMASTYTFSFTTAPLGPTVSSSDPSNGATEVPTNKTIAIKFADTINTGPSWSSITFKDGNGNTISASISLSDQNTIVIDPTGNLTLSTVYKVNIPSDAVKDSDGRYMTAAYALSFTAVKSIIPDKPIRLKVTATSASTIQIAWNETKNALSYNVYRRSGKDPFVKLFNTSTNSFADVSVAKKVTYVYAVSAIGTGGESAKSSEVPAYIGMTLPQFADVSNGDWYKVYVDALCKRNAITGYSDDLFHPENNITRAEFAKILCIGMGWPLRTPKNPTYQDVPKTHWAFAYIETASSNKAFQGYVDRSFKPDVKLYRAEVAKIGATALKLRKGSSKLKDINSSWAKNYINMCVAAHVISGFPDGTYKPGLMITRAEAARIICGMITYNTKKK